MLLKALGGGEPTPCSRRGADLRSPAAVDAALLRGAGGPAESRPFSNRAMRLAAERLAPSARDPVELGLPTPRPSSRTSRFVGLLDCGRGGECSIKFRTTGSGVRARRGLPSDALRLSDAAAEGGGASGV
jgi:hypothetical protein